MDVDILQPATSYIQTIIERPSHHASASSSKSVSSGVRTPEKYAEPVSEGEEDENMDLAPAKDEDKRTGLTGIQIAEVIKYREEMLKTRRESEARSFDSRGKMKAREKGIEDDDADADADDDDEEDERTPFLKTKKNKAELIGAISIPKKLPIDPLVPSSAFDETLRDRLRQEKQELQAQNSSYENEDEDEADEARQSSATDDRVLARDVQAPAGKIIAVPVRVEPKVYFAAERTFLVSVRLEARGLAKITQKWLNIAVFLGTIATTLLNFTSPEDSRGLISAALFTLCALIAIAYSASIFVYRAFRLRARRAEGLYYDKYGPTILCFAIFGAMGANIWLRVVEMVDE